MYLKTIYLQGAVASTSSTPPVTASAASMPDNASNDAKPKGKGNNVKMPYGYCNVITVGSK